MKRPKSAKDIMKTQLVTFAPDCNLLSAIDTLVRREITGGPIVEADSTYVGMFSEKCCMRIFDCIAGQASEDGVFPETLPMARDFMTTQLVTLAPDTDVFTAIEHLLESHISGAPVIDPDRHFLGVFSEKNSMTVLIQGAYEQLPSTRVASFMNTDPDRTIPEDTDLMQCVEIFLNTPYRRLPVIRDGKLVGQVSRRDVLRVSRVVTGGERMEKYIDGPLRDSSGGSRDKATVRDFMDAEARVIDEDIDLLRIAQIFFDTPYRRLPVLREGKLIGQVSRRDVLQATHDLMAVAAPSPDKALLYLSALVEGSHEVPIK